MKFALEEKRRAAGAARDFSSLHIIDPNGEAPPP